MILLEQRDKDEGGSPASDDSTDSNMTARAGNQTDNEDLPLLMQTDHHSSPEKPVTAKRSKLDEHEEVNALDLESLQLQDREIAFDKLTKLEKIGSGGFKVSLKFESRNFETDHIFLGRLQRNLQEEIGCNR